MATKIPVQPGFPAMNLSIRPMSLTTSYARTSCAPWFLSVKCSPSTTPDHRVRVHLLGFPCKGMPEIGLRMEHRALAPEARHQLVQPHAGSHEGHHPILPRRVTTGSERSGSGELPHACHPSQGLHLPLNGPVDGLSSTMITYPHPPR